MINELKSVLLERAAEWNLPTAKDWRFLFLNNYQPNYSTLTVLWFHGGSGFPNVVTKLFRQAAVPQQEWENLAYIHSRVPWIAPRPLHFGVAGQFWALWMEGVPGLPLSSQKAYSHDLLRSMVETVISIHSAVRQPVGSAPDGRHSRLVTQPLETLANFGNSSLVREGCTKLATVFRPESIQALAVIPQHGDLFDGNAFICRNRFHVIDWESYGAVDLPLYDLFTLLFSLLRKHGDRPSQWNSPIVKEYPSLVARYTSGLGLSRAVAASLLPLSLANWFHIQWRDGRKDFADRMYRTMEDYFRNPTAWDRMFVGQ